MSKVCKNSLGYQENWGENDGSKNQYIYPCKHVGCHAVKPRVKELAKEYKIPERNRRHSSSRSGYRHEVPTVPPFSWWLEDSTHTPSSRFIDLMELEKRIVQAKAYVETEETEWKTMKERMLTGDLYIPSLTEGHETYQLKGKTSATIQSPGLMIAEGRRSLKQLFGKQARRFTWSNLSMWLRSSYNDYWWLLQILTVHYQTSPITIGDNCMFGLARIA